MRTFLNIIGFLFFLSYSVNAHAGKAIGTELKGDKDTTCSFKFEAAKTIAGKSLMVKEVTYDGLNMKDDVSFLENLNWTANGKPVTLTEKWISDELTKNGICSNKKYKLVAVKFTKAPGSSNMVKAELDFEKRKKW